MIKITHIINPVKLDETSDLYVAQPVTFETMKRAKAFANKDLQVNLITTQFKEDHSIIPDFFTKTPDLTHSILDFGVFNKQRKLPLVKDILQRAIDFDSDSDYIIYTNVDIALMPHFYLFIKEKIESGLDAFIINRRTIASHYTVNDLELAYCDSGVSHPGYDCFVFKKTLFKNFVLNDICIGAVYIGLVLFVNMKLFARHFQEFGQEHLTFHIGNDQIWRNNQNNEFADHNKNEFEKIKLELSNKSDDFNSILDSAFPDINKNQLKQSPSRWRLLLKKLLNI